MEYNKLQYPNASPGYLENQPAKPFYHTNLASALQVITLKATREKEKSLLEKMLSDKATTSKATVRALLDEIRLRETLDSYLLRKLDDEICRQHTDLMQPNNFEVHYSPDLAKDVTKRKLQLEANVLELEKEKRISRMLAGSDVPEKISPYIIEGLLRFDQEKKRAFIRSN